MENRENLPADGLSTQAEDNGPNVDNLSDIESDHSNQFPTYSQGLRVPNTGDVPGITLNELDYDFFFNRTVNAISDDSSENDSFFSRYSSSNSGISLDDESSVDTSDSGGEDLAEVGKEKVEKKIIALVAFMHKHRLKANIIPDLISLLSVVSKIETGQPPLFPFKAEQVRQYLRVAKYPIQEHYYCTNCHASVDADSLHCTQCAANFVINKAKSFFVGLSVAKQAEGLLSKRSLYDYISANTRRNEQGQGTLNDITDGRIYQNFKASLQPQADQITLTFCFNTDGVRVFKSNHYDIWPVYLAVLELPESERFLPQNLILASTWHGPKKPKLLQFFRPFFEEMQQLGREGVEIQTPEGPKLLKAYVLGSTMDLPARALCLNMTSYNGDFSCHRCLIPGERVRTDGGGTVQCYPLEVHEMRTRANVRQDVATALETGQITRGLKGPSPLAYLPCNDICKGTVIDAMHGPMNGIFRQLVTLFFHVDNRGLPFNRHENASYFGKRLISILPPHIVKRPPRTLDHIQHFKCSEWAMCLLFYMPAFYSLIPDEYLAHLTLLSNAVFIFYQHSITPAELAHAEACLNTFCAEFERLYGKRYLSANFHNLQHLAEDVRNFGPLWNTDCFAYENASGHLLKKIHGTRSVPSQLVTAISLMHKMPYIAQENADCDILGPFLTKMGVNGHENKERAVVINAERGLSALPPIKKVSEPILDILTGEVMALLACHVTELKNVSSFCRFRKGTALYHTAKYVRPTKKNSQTICYEDGDQTGLKFAIAEEAYSATVVTRIQPPFDIQFVKIIPLEICEDHFIHAKHIKGVTPPKPDNPRRLIHMRQIKGLCVFMQFSAIQNRCFVSALPNITHIV